MIDETAIRLRFEALRPSLEERRRRLFAAVEARAAGVGGVAAVYDAAEPDGAPVSITNVWHESADLLVTPIVA